MGLSARNKNPKAPTRLNTMVVITIREYLGDSNWIAMAIKIRKIAVTKAWPREPSSSFICSVMAFGTWETPCWKSHWSTNASISGSAVSSNPGLICMVIFTW